jgi:hypothetical protein
VVAKRKPLSEVVRRIALGLDGVEERPSYGTPAFFRGKKLLARLHQDGVSLVLRIDFDGRDALLESDPDVFYVTPHYDGYPAVLVRLEKVEPALLKQLLADAWERAGSAKRKRT